MGLKRVWWWQARAPGQPVWIRFWICPAGRGTSLRFLFSKTGTAAPASPVCRAGGLAEACVNRERLPCVSSLSFLAFFVPAGILLFVVRMLAWCPAPQSPFPWPGRGCFQSLPRLLSGPGEVAGLCGPSHWVSGIAGVLSTPGSLITDPRGWGVLLDPQERCLDSGFMARSLCSAGSVCFPCLSRGASWAAPAPCMLPAARGPGPRSGAGLLLSG